MLRLSAAVSRMRFRIVERSALEFIGSPHAKRSVICRISPILIVEVGQAQAVLIHDQFYPARLFSAIAGAWPVAYQRSDRTSLPLASDPRCMSPLLALRDLLRCRAILVAFGAKRTSTSRPPPLNWSKMTPIGSRFLGMGASGSSQFGRPPLADIGPIRRIGCLAGRYLGSRRRSRSRRA
jgi:hypothetical protein